MSNKTGSERRFLSFERRLSKMETNIFRPHWRGTKAGALTTTDLPKHGDFGYNTSTSELYFNIGGTIRKVTTSAV